MIPDQRLGIFAGGFISAWLSIVITALAVALQLAFSGVSPASLAIPAMGVVHAVIGVGEGLITVGALAFLYATRRDLILAQEQAPKAGALVWLAGLGLALLLAVASPWASSHPDGLEWVAEQQGFLETAQDPFYNIIPDYVVPGVSNEALATILAGIVGSLLVFGAALLIARSRRSKDAANPPHAHP
jgi:cobalt/nickel transport system permease protein